MINIVVVFQLSLYECGYWRSIGLSSAATWSIQSSSAYRRVFYWFPRTDTWHVMFIFFKMSKKNGKKEKENWFRKKERNRQKRDTNHFKLCSFCVYIFVGVACYHIANGLMSFDSVRMDEYSSHIHVYSAVNMYGFDRRNGTEMVLNFGL